MSVCLNVFCVNVWDFVFCGYFSVGVCVCASGCTCGLWFFVCLVLVVFLVELKCKRARVLVSVTV